MARFRSDFATSSRRTSRTKFWISVAARMFSRAFSTRRNAATAWTCVASSRIPMRPESMLARNRPDGEFPKAALLKKPTASSIVAIALLWKKGPVSAASTSGGGLKVPLPDPGTPATSAGAHPPSGGVLATSMRAAGRSARGPVRPGEMLSDRSDGELSQRTAPGRTVPRPSRPLVRRHRGAVVGRRPKGGVEGEDVRHTAHREFGRKVIEAVDVLEDQADLSHEFRLLEVLRKSRRELGHEEWIIGRQRRDELRIDGEVVLGGVTRPARPPLPLSRLAEEEVGAPHHQAVEGRDLGGRCERRLASPASQRRTF